MHARRTPSRRRFAGALATVGALVALAGCSGTSGADGPATGRGSSGSSTSTTVAPSPVPTPTPAVLVTKPLDRAADVRPDTPVTVEREPR